MVRVDLHRSAWGYGGQISPLPTITRATAQSWDYNTLQVGFYYKYY